MDYGQVGVHCVVLDVSGSADFMVLCGANSALPYRATCQLVRLNSMALLGVRLGLVLGSGRVETALTYAQALS